jgi:hypothetical protein
LLAIIWIAVAFLLVRIAIGGEFTLGGLQSVLDENKPQLTLLTLAAAGSLLFAWRSLRTQKGGADAWSVGWSVVVMIVSGALRLLGHDSATVILGLAALGGLLGYSGLRATSR